MTKGAIVKEEFKKLQAGLEEIIKLQEDTLVACGWEKCTLCEEWHKKDELIFNNEIWDCGICEDCHKEHYESDPLYNK